MPANSTPRLLICTVPEMVDAAVGGLAQHYACTITVSVSDACSHLDVVPDAILCNLHFDDGRLFDFLSFVRTHPNGRAVPFIVSQSREMLTPSMIKGIEAASRSIGIEAFIEVYRWRQEFGADGADDRVREVIDAVIGTRRAGR